MTVLLERTEQTEPYFLLAHAIIGGLIRPAEAMRYVREYTPAGENKLNAEAMLFIGLVLADFRRGYERRTTPVPETFLNTPKEALTAFALGLTLT